MNTAIGVRVNKPTAMLQKAAGCRGIRSEATLYSHLPAGAQIPLMILALFSIIETCQCLQDATMNDLLRALARSQPSAEFGGQQATASSFTQSVKASAAGIPLHQRSFPLSKPAVVLTSAKLVGRNIFVHTAQPQQFPDETQQQQLVAVDLRDAPPGLILLPVGIELTLEDIVLRLADVAPQNLEITRTSRALGDSTPSDVSQPIFHYLSALIAQQLLAHSSRGTVILQGVILDFCRMEELSGVTTTTQTAGGVDGDPPQQPHHHQEDDTISQRITTRGRLRGAVSSSTSQPHQLQLLQEPHRLHSSASTADIASGLQEVMRTGEDLVVPYFRRVVNAGGAMVVLRDVQVRQQLCTDITASAVRSSDGAPVSAVSDLAVAGDDRVGAEGARRESTEVTATLAVAIGGPCQGQGVGHSCAIAASARTSARTLLAALAAVESRHGDPRGVPPSFETVSAPRAITAGVLAVVAVLAAMGVAWIRRLMSCACMAPSATSAELDNNTTGTGSRSVHDGKGAMVAGGSSHSHALLALSRFSAQLRKGDDPSVRNGSRRGSVLFAENSVRGGSHHTAPTPMELPPFLKDLSELRPVGQGRLVTCLQGLWQHQQRVVVKVVSHGEDCSFMLEQVGEVWTRLTHDNIVVCIAAETFPAAALAATRQDLVDLIHQPTNPDATLQTWIVLEYCDDGSLASVLKQRHQQQQAGKAAASTAGTGGVGNNDPVKDVATARQLTRRLGHSSRGSNCSTLTTSGSTAVAVASPPDPAPQILSPPPHTPLVAVVGTLEDEPCSSSGGTAEAAAKPPSPILLSLPRASKQQQTALGALAETSAPSNPSSVGGEDSGCEMPIQLLPGLLPVAEVLSIAHDVASGLSYLHSLDLCHGDLRAENIMMAQTIVQPTGAREASSGESTVATGYDTTVVVEGDSVTAMSVAAITLSYNSDSRSAAGAAVRGGGQTGVAVTGAADAMSAGAAVAVGSCHTVEEGVPVMYDMDASNTSAAAAIITSPTSATATTYHRSTMSNVSSYGNTASCTGVPNSSGHPWSSSLRHSNGYTMGSAFASMTTQSLAAGGGSGGTVSGGGTSVSRCLDPGSVDERFIPASLPSQGLRNAMSQGYLSPSSRPTGRSEALSNKESLYSAGGDGGGSGQYGSLTRAASSGVLVFGEVAMGTAGAGGVPDGSGLAGSALTASAVAALSHAMGISSNTPQHTPMTQQQMLQHRGGGGSGSPYIRRPSNSSLSMNTNSGNDNLMSKALSGLTAWPESPHEGRSVLASGAVASSGTSSGVQVPVRSVATTTTAVSTTVALSRTASGAFGSIGSVASPARKVSAVVGGLKSALTAPDNAVKARTPPLPPAAAPPPPPLLRQSNAPTDLSPFTPPQAQARSHASPLQEDTTTATLAAAQLSSTNSTGALGAGASAPEPSLPSPGIMALQINTATVSSAPPSPTGGGGSELTRPSSNTAPATPTGGAVIASRRRPSVGVVCTIGGRQGHCSCTPSSAVPLLANRWIAKLSDPWLSLARMPPEYAGGPWSPEAAEAVGVTSGADVAHLPPELLLSGRLHPSSDVYSLGILMWRLLSSTGEAPYGKLRPAEVAYKVVACGMRPSFSPTVPEPLRRLVEDCWKSDPSSRPTVQQVLQRLTELQPCSTALQNQWRERHILFGAVSTVPISAVAILQLRGDQNEVTVRWAEAAGIRLLRTSTSFGGSGSGSVTMAPASAAAARCGGGEMPAYASFVRGNSRGQSGTANVTTSYTSIGRSGSAAHLYAQPPPPTPPAGLMTTSMQFVTVMPVAMTTESSNHSIPLSDGHAARGSQSNHHPASPYTGNLSLHPNRRGGGGSGGAALEPF